MRSIETRFIAATDCNPVADDDFFQVSCYDSDGITWYANEEFATARDAVIFIFANDWKAEPTQETGWVCAGPSYSLGQVDEASLMDDEERQHKGIQS